MSCETWRVNGNLNDSYMISILVSWFSITNICLLYLHINEISRYRPALILLNFPRQSWLCPFIDMSNPDRHIYPLSINISCRNFLIHLLNVYITRVALFIETTTLVTTWPTLLVVHFFYLSDNFSAHSVSVMNNVKHNIYRRNDTYFNVHV